MSKVRIAEEEISKLNESEKKKLDAHTNAVVFSTLLNFIGLPVAVISFMAHMVWSNKLTLFLSSSIGFLGLCALVLLIYTYVNAKSAIKKLKEKVSTR